MLAKQVHISHVGQMRFKGVAEVQSVMQFSTAHLAARQFPTDPPSAKADLVMPYLAVHRLVCTGSSLLLLSPCSYVSGNKFLVCTLHIASKRLK